ncbi:MAG: EpsI family protein [candidate division KSB1 bacterium]|nr:EpsI family protein [candidate division KSB1 bacterium]
MDKSLRKAGLIAILLILTKAGMSWVQDTPKVAPLAYDFGRDPIMFDGWTCFYMGELDSLTKSVLGTQEGYIHKYREGGLNIEAVTVRFQDQKFEAQVHSPLHCLPGSGWEIIRREKIVQENGYVPLYATLLNIKKGTQIQNVLYWFMINGKIVQNIYQLKLEVLKNRLLRRGITVYFFRLNTLNDDVILDQQQVRSKLLRFARNYIHTIHSKTLK